MKKRLLAILLALTMVLTLLPVTAFATGTSYAITNGTAQDAHGSISFDKTAAAEGDTVTITVNPADGYQLKSLTVAPTGFVDLGIKDAEGKPLYWKETNLGANNAFDPGDYYMWGATALMYSAVDRSKTDGAFTFVTENPYGDNYKNTWDASLGFNFNNVPFADGVFKNNDGERNVFTKYTTIDKYAKSGTPDNITTLQPEDDAATAKNANWHTPTYDELVALATNCVLVWTFDYNSTGNAGYIVYKAKNGADKGKVNMNGTWKMWDAANSKYITNTGSAPTGYSTSDIHIFLPAAGYGNNTELLSKNTAGAYCSSDLNNTSRNDYVGAVNFNKSVFNIAYNYFRSYGFSVRPVMNFSGITPAKQDDGTSQFTMPGYPVTVTAEFEEVPAHTHEVGTKHEAVAPTCTADGTIEWYSCTDPTCEAYLDAAGNELESIVDPALGHDFSGDAVSNNDGTHSFLCVNGCNEYGGAAPCVDELVDGKCDICGQEMPEPGSGCFFKKIDFLHFGDWLARFHEFLFGLGFMTDGFKVFGFIKYISEGIKLLFVC